MAMLFNSDLAVPANFTANHSIALNEYRVRGDATGSAFTFTLPDNASAKGECYAMEKVDPTANAITYAAAGSDSILASSLLGGLTLASKGSTITLYANGDGTWSVIGKV